MRLEGEAVGDVELDGSVGEGGGQILRTALALSAISGRAFSIERIRAGRKKPGLLRQHLTAVHAAKAVANAAVAGCALGATSLRFAPSVVTHGDRRFAVGTAGSALLVLQTILPPLLTAPGRSTLVLEGGTHAPSAPPWPFVARAFLPLLRRMGASVDGRLERAGFFPAGGGRVVVDVHGGAPLAPLSLLSRGPVRAMTATAVVARLDGRVGEREIGVVQDGLGLARADVAVDTVASDGPGNLVALEIVADDVVEVVSACGARGVPAERVAQDVVDEARALLATDAPVGAHLCDQLLIPLALAGGGAFRTVPPTLHSTTNAAVIERFLDVRVRFVDEGATSRVVVERRGGGGDAAA